MKGTVGQILKFCKQTWVSGGVPHFSVYPPFFTNLLMSWLLILSRMVVSILSII